MADNIQVRDASGTLLTMRTQDVGGIHTPYQRVMGYDAQDDMLKVKSVQKKFRDSFPGAALDTTKWDSSIGSGGSITVTGGTLVMASGVNASAETSVTTKETFTVPFRVSFSVAMSQRIANQTLLIEAISVDPVTGNPDGLHSAAILFDGTTATQGKYRVQNSGITPLDSAASTFPTTASGGFYEIEPFADECWFHGGTLDSTAGRANSYRRHQQIPDPNAVYKLRLRWLNGGTAPASTTTATFQYITCQDYAELTAEITAGRGQTVAGQAIGVSVVSAPTTNVVPTPSTSQGASTTNHLISAATTNATSVKTAAGVINDITLSNNAASPRYFKLYNKASAPTVGTDTPVRTVMIPANTTLELAFAPFGFRFSTGIAYAITAGIAVADTTAIGANEVAVGMSYA